VFQLQWAGTRLSIQLTERQDFVLKAIIEFFGG